MNEAARSLLEAAQSARYASDFRSLERIARELLALGERDGDAHARASGYYHLGIALTNLNRTKEAIAATRSAIATYGEIGDRLAAARTTMNLGAIALDLENDAATARRLYEESLPVIRELGLPVNLGIGLGNIGEICRLEGDYEGALRNAQEALEIFRETGDPANLGWILTDIAHYQLLLRRTPDAIASMQSAFEHLVESKNPRWIAWYFDVWFLIAARLDRWEAAEMLLAFTDKYRDEQNQPRSQAMLPWFSEPRERLAREVRGARVEELVEAGEALSLESAFDLATNECEAAPRRHAPGGRPGGEPR